MNNYKILVVDDEIQVLQVMLRLLEEAFPESRLYQSTNGEQALRMIESVKFDLVISDWDMPKITGIDLTKQIKSNEKTKHIPVIIATGVMITSKDLTLALEAGAHDYIRKPIDPVELTARINSAIKFTKLYTEIIEQKNLELVEKTMLLVKYHEFTCDIKKQINYLLEIETQSESLKVLEDLLSNIDEKIKTESWQKFEVAFKNVHTEFLKKLVTNYPDLTPSEVKLSMFIKLGMNIKDVSSLLYISPESLKVARSRLRKKFGLEQGANLQNFLIAL